MVSSTVILASLICLGSLFLLMAAAAVLWLQNRQQDREMSPQKQPKTSGEAGADWLEALAERGSPDQDQPQDLETQVRALMRKGRKIDAIKIYRQATGVGLKEAKDAVEMLEQR